MGEVEDLNVANVDLEPGVQPQEKGQKSWQNKDFLECCNKPPLRRHRLSYTLLEKSRRKLKTLWTFRWWGEVKVIHLCISLKYQRCMTFTSPHQQIFIEFEMFADFFLTVYSFGGVCMVSAPAPGYYKFSKLKRSIFLTLWFAAAPGGSGKTNQGTIQPTAFLYNPNSHLIWRSPLQKAEILLNRNIFQHLKKKKFINDFLINVCGFDSRVMLIRIFLPMMSVAFFSTINSWTKTALNVFISQ